MELVQAATMEELNDFSGKKKVGSPFVAYSVPWRLGPIQPLSVSELCIPVASQVLPFSGGECEKEYACSPSKVVGAIVGTTVGIGVGESVPRHPD